MAKSNSKTTVFNGRKEKFTGLTSYQWCTKQYNLLGYIPPVTKAPHNVGRLTKTQRKEAARVKRSFKDKKLQNQLVKQHIGAGLIFGLVSRCTNPVWTP